VVTGSGHPASSMVYKLVARRGDAGEWIPVAKKSAAKATVGGRKHPVRTLVDGVATAETIYVGDAPADRADERALLVPLVVAGEPVAEYLGAHGTGVARTHRAAAVAELPASAFRLSRGEPAIPTVYA
jgi:nicotinate phosphoribosyltransferase